MSKPRVGQLLTGSESIGRDRDVIHVPIMRVKSGDRLFPGEKVKLEDGSAVPVENGDKVVGVVDPFLECSAVGYGDEFYLWLRPESTFRLWHDWTHSLVDGKTAKNHE